MAQTTVSAIKDVKKLGTILSVWAHPDDESFSCAGLMAAAVQNGQRVVCVTATKGEAGVQDANRWPAEQLGEIRSAELAAALEILGITIHHWLGYADGACAEVNADGAVMQLVELLRTYRPDTILTFGPDGMTGHPDHQTVSAWVTAAVRQLGNKTMIYHAVQLRDCYETYLKPIDEQFNIFFNIEEPPLRQEAQCDICFCLPEELLELKIQALRAMPSQTEAMLKDLPPETLLATFSMEAFEAA